MNKLKRKMTSVFLAVSMLSAMAVPALAKDSDKGYATREYVVSQFVQSVGRANLTGSGYILSTFKDANEVSDEYVNDLEKATTNGLLQGYEDKTIRPKENVTRIEALAMLSRCIPETTDVDAEAIQFTDVPDWAKEIVDGLSKIGIVKGYGDGRLGAEDNITVEQVKLLTDRSDELLNTVKPGESFYGYINNKAFRNYENGSGVTVDALHGVIIPNENMWSYMKDMSKNLIDNEKDILTKLVNGELKYEKDTPEQRIYDMLECIELQNSQDEQNPKDIELYNSYRKMITDAKTIDEFLKAAEDICNQTGVNIAFDISVGLEPEKHEVYPQISPVSTNLGSIISFSKSAQKMFGSEYRSILKEFLKYSGAEFGEKDIEKACEIQEMASKGVNNMQSYAIGKVIRMSYDPTYTQEMMQKEMDELAEEHPELFEKDGDTYTEKNPLDMINVYTSEEADKKFSGVKLSDMLKNIGFKDVDHIIMSNVGNIEACSNIFKQENLNALKINGLLVLFDKLMMTTSKEEKEVNDKMQLLSLAVLSGLSYEKVQEYFAGGITGDVPQEIKEPDEEQTKADKWLTDANLQTIGALLPNDIGLLYCKYFYDDKISDVIAKMTTDIWDAYKKRFEKNTWMSEETKKNAIKKIENMVAVIGYPDNYEFPDIVSVDDGGTMFKNSLNISKDNLNTIIRMCSEKEFLRTMMLMSPDTINACYSSVLNSMNIPAAFTQWPIYDPDASYASNLGALGSVIAHEIGHAFDADGSQYDENGCLKNWWTDEDAKKYDEKKQNFVDYYKNFKVMDGVVQNSEVTITENMADMAGIQCVFDIIGDDKEAQKEALESYARIWARIGSASVITGDNYMQDVHSANQVRVNAVVASLDCFYDIYDIKEGDPMYVAPENRLKLW